MGWLSLLLFVGCQGEPSALTKKKQAIAHFERGQSLLERGQYDKAVSAFLEAEEVGVGAQISATWRAKTLVESGQTDRGISVAQQVLKGGPVPGLRLQLATWYLQVGDLKRAAEETQLALKKGEVSAKELRADDRFVDALNSPEFSFLPKPSLVVSLAETPKTAFWGTEFDLQFTILNQTAEVLIESEQIKGPFRLVSVVETQSQSELTVAYRLRVTGSGGIALGPFVVVSGDQKEQVADVVVVDTQAPKEKIASKPPPRLYSFSSAKKEAAGRTAWVNEHGLFVAHLPADKLVITPLSKGNPPVSLIRREGHKTMEVISWWPSTKVKTVTIRRAGTVVFDGEPAR